MTSTPSFVRGPVPGAHAVPSGIVGLTGWQDTWCARIRLRGA